MMAAEPVRIFFSGLANLVQAVLILLLAFEVELTNAQTAAIMGLTTIVTNIVLAEVTRARTTPT